MKLILIAGRARSGKTEAAKILKQLLIEKGYKALISEYSKYIKLFAKEFTDWDGITEPKPRKFLQNFGYYVRHESDNPNYFIERMKEDVAIYQNFIDVLILSDVRLPNEIMEMEYLNPIVIHVQNDRNPYDLSLEESRHETEHALDNFENFQYSIKNKTTEEIKAVLKDIIEKEFGK